MTQNIGQFISKRAKLNPNTEAVVDVASGRRYNYVELNDRVNRVANALVGQGVTKGDRVATLLMNGPEFIESFYGTAKIGGVVVALNWRLVADELSFILNDSGAKTLIFSTEFNDVVSELHTRATDGSAITTWIHVGDDADRPEFAVGYESLAATAADTEPDVTAGDDDLLFIMYTSGTTGLPKGVMHSHKTALWATITANATADIRFDDRYLICLPLFHVGALNPLLCIANLGGTAVIMSEFHPLKIWEIYAAEKVTVTLAVPAMLQFMLTTFDPAVHDITQLRWVMSGASPVPETLIRSYEALGIEIHQVYGLTESCGPACLISPDDALDRAGSTGKEFFFTEVKVVNESGTICAPNEPGEVLVAGEHIMVGYWNRPEATEEAVIDGWLRTGDIAIVDEDGFVYIQDRVKDMLISGGENVYPAEIENVILGLDGVVEVAVIGVPSQAWGESPLAIVVSSSDTLTEREVLDHCAGKLAKFKQPKAVEFVDVIPRNPTGKTLKRVLRDQFAETKVD